MKKFRWVGLFMIVVLACIANNALAQEDTMPARPMYAHPKPNLSNAPATTVTPLTTWNGSFVYGGITYKYNMVGKAPSSGISTTIPVFLIPVKMIYNTTSGTTMLDPATAKLSNGQTVQRNTIASPIFQSGIDFVTGGIDLGNTQYTDAFQRGNFWKMVSKHTGYHVLLGKPTVLKELTLTVPTTEGRIAKEFGITVGLAAQGWFDQQLQSYISSMTKIVPNSLPIFLTYDVYLTSGGCCIGGYHSAMGSQATPQAYVYATYIDTAGKFAQDVSALSHEVAEWADDPLVVNKLGNQVFCGILEVGDPEVPFLHHGAFPYTLNGFTYNLQDLVYLPYFGAAASTSANDSLTFQGNPFGLTVCSNGG